ncbi:hypothetical protein ACVXHB_09355 [Escherichia coli]
MQAGYLNVAGFANGGAVPEVKSAAIANATVEGVDRPVHQPIAARVLEEAQKRRRLALPGGRRVEI